MSYINGITYDRVRAVGEAACLLAKKPEIAQIIITHQYPIDGAPEALRIATQRNAGAIKVVIEP